MAAQAFVTPPLAYSRPRLLSHNLGPSYIFSSSRKCSTKVVASVTGTFSKPESALADIWASWRTAASCQSSRSTNLYEVSPVGTNWCVLLFRALLVGGISLRLGHPALALASPAPIPASEVISQDFITNHNSVAKTSRKTEEKDSHYLSAEFWKGMDLERGSPQLILKNVLDGDPMDLSALECLARLLMDTEDYSRALLVLEKLEILQPKELEWKYMKAEAYDLDGKSQLAKTNFEDILKVEPFSSRALQGLVLAMDELDESDSALNLLHDTWIKAKQENNRVEAGNFGMLIGQIYTFKGRLQDALQHYNGMLEEDANDFRPYLCQGIIYSALGDTEMAEKQFQTFEKLCPKDVDREFFNGLMSRARTEGRRVFEFKQKQKAKSEKKGAKGR